MKIINPEIAFDNYYDKTRYIIARNITLFTFLILLVLLYFFRFQTVEVLACYISAAILTCVSSLYILYYKNYNYIFYTLTIGGTFLVQLSANTGTHMLHYGAFNWSFLATVLAFFGVSLRFGVALLVFNLIGASFFFHFFFDQNIEYLLNYSPLQQTGILIENAYTIMMAGYIMYHFGLFHKHSEELLKNKNIKLKNAANDNVVLVKEIHHRVKNNLQIIISLLRLQKGELKSEEAKLQFNEAINRIMVMSLIHEKLYQQEELATINIKSYLKDLSADITSITDLDSPIKVKVQSNINTIGLKTIVPLGLLVNELITNSVKHAFLKKKNGIIQITIKQHLNTNNFTFIYSDNGEWIEHKKSKPSFGTELIAILTTQLEGDFTRTSNIKGTTYTFNIKNIDIEK